jgi:hypothetical protein
MLKRFVLVFATAALVCLGSMQAQDTGRISGTVTDSSGAVVTGAAVRIVNTQTAIERTMQTDVSGRYEIPRLPVGPYSVSVSMQGFQTASVPNLDLHIDQDLRVDVQMRVGSTAETVEVTAAPPLTETSSSEIGNVIQENRVRELPLNGRNILQLALLAPGATEAEPQSGVERFTFNSGGFTVSINGGRTDQNLYVLDGIWNGVVYFNQQNINPTVDMISEFRVKGTNADASSGFGHGGIVTYATRSGGNDFHGKLWEFVRNDIFDAKNYFDTKKPAYRQNQFGGVFSGPLFRGKYKSFFAVSYEQLQIRKGLTAVQTLPTAKQISGDFSADRPIFDPLTTRPDPARPGQFIRDRFLNNIIPANRIAAPSAYLASFLPKLAVGGVGNYINNSKRTNRRDQANVRLDHSLSQRDQVFARFTLANFLGIEPLGVGTGANPPFNILPVTENAFSRNLALGWTHSFSNNLLNDFRFGFNRARLPREQRGPDFFTMFNIPGSNRSPADFGLPAVSVTGFTAFGANDTITPFLLTENDFQWANDTSWVRGKHTFKFGGNFMRTQLIHQFDFFAKGSLSFQSAFTTDPQNRNNTGNAFADFLLGFPTQNRIGLGSTYSHSFEYRIESYFNDTWKIVPRLTLNMGVRYEVMRPPLFAEPLSTLAKDGRIVVSVPDNGPLPPQVNLYAGKGITFVTAKDAGYPATLVDTDKNNFAPRVGLAWDVAGDAKTVVRSGYGLFYSQRQQINTSAQFINDIPFYNMSTVLNQGVGFAANPTSLTPTLNWSNMIVNNVSLPGGTAFPRSLPFGEIQQWSLGIQRSLWTDAALETDYVGTSARKLLGSYNPNQVDFLGEGCVGIGAGYDLPANCTRNAPRTRPFPQFGNFTSWQPKNTSSYNALIVNLNQRSRKGLTFQAGYTWSHSIDTSSGENVGGTSGNGTRNSYASVDVERGNSNFDTRHRFTLSTIYQLPIGPRQKYWNVTGALGKLLEGWQVGGIATYSKGVSFTVTQANDPTGLGLGLLPNVVCNPNEGAPHTVQQWFNTACFVTQGTSYGNAGRNIVSGPPIKNFDLYTNKSTALTERMNLAFRAEFFNAFNTPQFLIPQRSLGGAGFGQILSARDPRDIQLSLALSF